EGAQQMTLEDGTPLSPALGIGAFVEETLVAAGQCTKVDPAVPPEVAGLLGCGVMAGLGAAINTGAVTRGDSVAVIGCGGVGDAAILGANLAGAHTIIAVDVDPRKLEWARQFGATHVINAREADPVAEIQALTGGTRAGLALLRPGGRRARARRAGRAARAARALAGAGPRSPPSGRGGRPPPRRPRALPALPLRGRLPGAPFGPGTGAGGGATVAPPITH